AAADAKDDRAPNWSRTWKFRMDDAAPKLAVKTTTHERVVRCESTSDALIRGEKLQVVQRLNFQVLYEPLAQVRLLAPRALADRPVISYNDEEVLPPSAVMPPTDDSPNVPLRVTIPQPRTGEFALVVRFVVDLPEAAELGVDSDVPVVLPILVPEEAT